MSDFHLISTRLLSVSETAIALRPFLFSVHPDLFGQFPKEQVWRIILTCHKLSQWCVFFLADAVNLTKLLTLNIRASSRVAPSAHTSMKPTAAAHPRASQSSFTAYNIDRGSMLKSTRWEKTPQQHWLANLVLANICDRSSFISISWCNKLFIFLFLSTFQINISLKSKHHIYQEILLIYTERNRNMLQSTKVYIPTMLLCWSRALSSCVLHNVSACFDGQPCQGCAKFSVLAHLWCTRSSFRWCGTTGQKTAGELIPATWHHSSCELD